MKPWLSGKPPWGDKRFLVKFVVWTATVLGVGYYTYYLTSTMGASIYSQLAGYATILIFALGFPELVSIGAALFRLTLRDRGGPRLSLSPRLMLVFVSAFGLFLSQIAYGLIQGTVLSTRVVYDVLSLTVAVEGVLLGLLSLSPQRSHPGEFQKIAGLAFISFIAILWSLSTIIYAESAPTTYPGVVSTVFLVSVWLFATVVIGYASMIMRQPSKNGNT